MNRAVPRRQSTRRAILLVTFLLFPIVINYLSPYLIIDSAALGIVNGSFIVFVLMFLAALVVGRLYCGWVCPAAGLMEACTAANPRPAKGGRLNWIKWGIWGVWITIIGLVALSAGGYRQLDFFYLTESGISVDAPLKYIIYYTVTGSIFALSLAFGRRSFCHYGCWMAPFMITGRKISNALRLPGLRLAANPTACTNCQECTRSCPMSLNVTTMVASGSMEHSECILCGTCADGCRNKAIRYVFQTPAHS